MEIWPQSPGLTSAAGTAGSPDRSSKAPRNLVPRGERGERAAAERDLSLTYK